MVFVRWIGYDLDLTRQDKPFGNEPIDGPSREVFFGHSEVVLGQYGLTVDGQAVCVDSYCVDIANYKSTHVVLFKDRDRYRVPDSKIDWTRPFNELELQDEPDYEGLARFSAYHSKPSFINE